MPNVSAYLLKFILVEPSEDFLFLVPVDPVGLDLLEEDLFYKSHKFDDVILFVPSISSSLDIEPLAVFVALEEDFEELLVIRQEARPLLLLI
jgi:hypothetical protein